MRAAGQMAEFLDKAAGIGSSVTVAGAAHVWEKRCEQEEGENEAAQAKSLSLGLRRLDQSGQNSYSERVS